MLLSIGRWLEFREEPCARSLGIQYQIQPEVGESGPWQTSINLLSVATVQAAQSAGLEEKGSWGKFFTTFSLQTPAVAMPATIAVSDSAFRFPKRGNLTAMPHSLFWDL